MGWMDGPCPSIAVPIVLKLHLWPFIVLVDSSIPSKFHRLPTLAQQLLHVMHARGRQGLPGVLNLNRSNPALMGRVGFPVVIHILRSVIIIFFFFFLSSLLLVDLFLQEPVVLHKTRPAPSGRRPGKAQGFQSLHLRRGQMVPTDAS